MIQRLLVAQAGREEATTSLLSLAVFLVAKPLR